MACAINLLKSHLNGLLLEADHDNSILGLEDRLDPIFSHGPILEIGSCSCIHKRGRHHPVPDAPSHFFTPIDADQLRPYQRLFATCIITDRAHLMTKFLGAPAGFNDANFKTATNEEDFDRVPGVDRYDARALLRAKRSFFGISLSRYLRSTRDPYWSDPEERRKERNWLIDELLELMRRMALLSVEDTVRMSTIHMDALVIRESDATINRTGPVTRSARDLSMSIASLGYLVLEILWFIEGGARDVLALDNKRSSNCGIASRNLSPRFDVDLEPDLSKAFQMAWVMIQVNEDPYLPTTDGSDLTYESVYKVFRDIWPLSTMHMFPTGVSSRSLICDSSSTGVSSKRRDSHFDEISKAEDFKWIIFTYKRGIKTLTGCRMKVFVSGHRLRFEIFESPVKSFLEHININSCSLVPLYIYSDAFADHGIRLQLEIDHPGYQDGHLNFYFQNKDDMRIFEALLTGREILTDATLQSFSIETRKSVWASMKRAAIPGVRAEVKKWKDIGNDVAGDCCRGVQIWRVMTNEDLVSDTQLEPCKSRVGQYKELKFEIALFREDALMVVGVKSIMNLKAFSSSKLAVASKKPDEYYSLTGRLHTTEDGDKLPGLPLFQVYPFKQPANSRVILLEKLTLGFKSKLVRENFVASLERMQLGA